MEIFVNEECIREGIKEDCGECPVALALHNAIKSYLHNTNNEEELLGLELRPNVTHDEISMEFVQNGIIYKNIYKADNRTLINDFIDAFDSDDEVEPFKFNIILDKRERYYEE